MMRTVQFRTYQPNEAIVFHKTNEQFGGLSNMAPGYKLKINNHQILTAEAFYQACRYPHLPEVQEAIILESSPITAKRYARKHVHNTRPDWESKRAAIMRWSLRAKLLQNQSTFGYLLLMTGSLPIVEYSQKDDFWGAKASLSGELVGRNVLGRLLMELRELYKAKQINMNVLEPLQISDFLLLGDPIREIYSDVDEKQQQLLQ